jgi:hypothetical protein
VRLRAAVVVDSGGGYELDSHLVSEAAGERTIALILVRRDDFVRSLEARGQALSRTN